MMQTSTNAFSGSETRNIARLRCNRVRAVVYEPNSVWRDEVKARLDKLVDLKIGWDGYQGRPVTFQNAYFAMQMLESACQPDALTPQIVPGSDGDLQVEWHLRGGDIELHVRAPNDVYAWRRIAATSDEEELHLTNDFVSVAEWIKELTESSLAADSAAA